MKDYTREEKDKMISLTAQVKDYIHTQAYTSDPAYKWLDECWSVQDILETMIENKLYTKEVTVKWLLDVAHLFGKDRI